MGLFDRLKGDDDEEVEIKPRDRGFDRDFEREDNREEDGTEGEEEFLLPGMKSASSGTDSSKGSSRSRSRDLDRTGELDRLVEQNERIIELLEELVDSER